MIEASVYQTLESLVGGRCYPLQMPQSPDYPTIVYSRIASAPQNRLEGGASLDQVRIQVDCYAETYDGAKTLSDSVRSAMQAAAFKATLQSDMDIFEGELKNIYRVMMDFYVWQHNT
jgi:hypothetical protein